MTDWSDRRPQRDRVMDEMERNRDERVKRAFHSGGDGDNGPAGIGRANPYRQEEDNRFFNPDRERERQRRERQDAPEHQSQGRAGRVTSWFSDDEPQRQQGSHRGKGPRGYSRSDSRIAEDINDRLTDDHHVDATEIQVQVQSGEVTLTGTVDSRSARRRAEDIAESVGGVTYVMNNLRVRQAGTSGATG